MDSVELPGADLSGLSGLSGDELTMPVIPKRAAEFTCASCFLVQHRSRLAAATGGPTVCVDCA